MAKEKKSFFERITGTVKVKDDEFELAEAETELVSERRDILDEEDVGELTVDVFQTQNDIVIKAMVAGVKPEDLDIMITRDMVTIKGKRETERSITEENYFFKELFWGTFSRTIMLPQEVEPEEAEAFERHGLITIRLPKIDKARQTKLRIKSV